MLLVAQLPNVFLSAMCLYTLCVSMRIFFVRFYSCFSQKDVKSWKGLKCDRERCTCYHICENAQLYRQLKNGCFIYSIALSLRVRLSIVNWLALDFTCKCHVSFARTNCLYLIKCISVYCTAHSLSLMLMLCALRFPWFCCDSAIGWFQRWVWSPALLVSGSLHISYMLVLILFLLRERAFSSIFLMRKRSMSGIISSLFIS